MMYPKLFTVDSKGATRVWWMERVGNKFCAHAGIHGGHIVTSGWKFAKPKNEGRANATTAEEQADLEVKSLYKKKKEKKYYDRIEDAAGQKYFGVMLAEKYKDNLKEVQAAFAAAERVLCQPKLDGIRATFTAQGAISRGGKPFFTVDHIAEDLAPLFAANPNLVLDGELYNHDLHDDFNKVSSLIRKTKPTADDLAEARAMVQYHVYDIPSSGDKPFSDRFGDLCELFGAHEMESVKLVETGIAFDQEELDDAYASWIADGYEGQMVRLDLPYENKRSASLLKRKEFFDEEFPLENVEEGEGNWAGYAKRCYIRLADGTISKAGIKGNRAFTKKLLEDWTQYTEVTVRFPSKTPDGKPRFPVAVDWHKGKRND